MNLLKRASDKRFWITQELEIFFFPLSLAKVPLYWLKVRRPLSPYGDIAYSDYWLPRAPSYLISLDFK